MALSDNFFRDPATLTNEFFDEGPIVVRKPTDSTGSIDTSAIDKFRQGVELTQLKHFDAGSMAKIHAGDPGHILKRTTFGDRSFFDRRVVYNDQSDLRAVALVSASIVKTSRSRVTAPFTANPALDASSAFYDALLFDGVIDPLGTNSRAKRLTIDQPIDARGERGALQSGNEEFDGSSDAVATVFEQFASGSAYDDLTASTIAWPTAGRARRISTSPYEDELNYGTNVVSESAPRDSSMSSALAAMTSSNDNYVPVGFRAMTSGWDYDSNEQGTDSIAFGGLTY